MGDTVLNGHLFGSVTDDDGKANVNAKVKMTLSEGFTVWQMAPLPAIGAGEVVAESAAPEIHEHLVEVTKGAKRVAGSRPYTGPILKPSAAERQRRQANGEPDAGDDPWVPCPRCAESQESFRRKRCDLCDGRGMVPYRVATDY